jgi:hypothetical protein
MIEANSAAEETSPVRQRRRNRACALAALALLVFSASAWPQASPEPTPKAARHGKTAAAAHHRAGKRRVISVTINKGETYTISGLKQGAQTDSKPGKNPNALSLQPQPSGDIVLLGTEAGRWKIDATLADGEKVTYDVKVKAEAPPINSLEPGSAPTAIGP